MLHLRSTGNSRNSILRSLLPWRLGYLKIVLTQESCDALVIILLFRINNKNYIYQNLGKKAQRTKGTGKKNVIKVLTTQGHVPPTQAMPPFLLFLFQDTLWHPAQSQILSIA